MLASAAFGLICGPSPTSRRAASTIASASIPASCDELGALARPGQFVDRKLDHPRAVGTVGERAEDRFADPALGSVILDDDQPAAGGDRRLRKRVVVDRLDRVQVDHAGVDAVAGELIGGLDRLMQCHPGADQRHLVIR